MPSQEILVVQAPRSPDAAAVEELKTSLRGQLLGPADPGYDEARRVWNGMADRRPALIARCAGPSDVIRAVNFARSQGMVVAVRGGGHSIPGHSVCDDGLMIDLSRMNGIRVDPVRRTARAEAGALLADLDHETQAFGLATTAGTVSHTGIAGLTLGGGQGWLMGLHGLTIDNLLSVDIVTADGRLLTASASENEDLFWAVRGGGGNFGVVTSFEYQLHPVGPMVLGGMVLYPLDRAVEVLRFYGSYMRSAPAALNAIAAIITAPDGSPVIGIVPGWFGPADQGERYVRPLREIGTPLVDMVGPIPYVQLQKTFDAAVPHGMHRYVKMGYLPELSDGLIDHVVDHMRRKTSPYSVCLFARFGGAATRIAPEATAFPHRREQWHFDVVAQWTDPAEAAMHTEWVRAFWRDVEPFSRGVGVNFMDADEGETRIQEAYAANYGRLVALKNRFDPTNFFRLNNNIAPSKSH